MTPDSGQIRTVGQMSLGGTRRTGRPFPFWRRCLESLRDQCDELYLRFDKRTGDTEALKQLDRVCGSKLKDVLVSTTTWNPWNWRQEMLRMLDSVEPDIVLVPDQDEEFEDSLLDELPEFAQSSKMGMMFSYVRPMPTDDDSVIWGGAAYPPKPHMKVFKWQANLSFRPYASFAKVTQYRSGKHHFHARTRILHYCWYTKELRKLMGIEE